MKKKIVLSAMVCIMMTGGFASAEITTYPYLSKVAEYLSGTYTSYSYFDEIYDGETLTGYIFYEYYEPIISVDFTYSSITFDTDDWILDGYETSCGTTTASYLSSIEVYCDASGGHCGGFEYVSQVNLNYCNYQPILTVIPEPATLMLLAFGAVALRKRK